MSAMTKLSVQRDHVKSIFELRRHFKNPWLLVLLRLGLIKTPYFLHRISKGNRRYAMLARPTTTSCADLFILRDVLLTEAYQDVLPHLPRNIRLLDIGANLGSFTIWMARTLGVREAFCFEPEPDSFRLLNFNLSLNDCKMARTVECAIGGESRMAKIALKQSSPGGTSLYMDYSSSPDATSVPVVALAEWLGGVNGILICSKWIAKDRNGRLSKKPIRGISRVSGCCWPRRTPIRWATGRSASSNAWQRNSVTAPSAGTTRSWDCTSVSGLDRIWPERTRRLLGRPEVGEKSRQKTGAS